MSRSRWVVTNLRPEIDPALSPPVSRLVVEMVGEPGSSGGVPVTSVGHRGRSTTRFLVTLQGAVLNMPADRLIVHDGLVRAVSWRTVQEAVRVEVETNFRSSLRLRWAAGLPDRLALELERSPLVQLLAGRRIGLDPGHGGNEVGAVGARYRECDVVLDISRFLSRWLAAHRAVCVLSRDDDSEVSPAQRLRLMLQERPDTYIGLHTGSDADRHRRGTTVLHRPDEASERMARSLHSAILARSPFLVDGGVHPSDEAMLSHLQSPAAILLPEYITHPLGEGLLRAVDFQERIAQSLFDGLIRYFRSSPGAGIPSESSPNPNPPPGDGA